MKFRNQFLRRNRKVSNALFSVFPCFSYLKQTSKIISSSSCDISYSDIRIGDGFKQTMVCTFSSYRLLHRWKCVFYLFMFFFHFSLFSVIESISQFRNSLRIFRKKWLLFEFLRIYTGRMICDHVRCVIFVIVKRSRKNPFTSEHCDYFDQ